MTRALLSIVERDMDMYKLMRTDPLGTLFIYTDTVEEYLDMSVVPDVETSMLRMYRLDDPRADKSRCGSFGIPIYFGKRSIACRPFCQEFMDLMAYVRRALSDIRTYLFANRHISTVIWAANSSVVMRLYRAVCEGRLCAEQAGYVQDLIYNEIGAITRELGMELLFYGTGTYDNVTREDVLRRLGREPSRKRKKMH